MNKSSRSIRNNNPLNIRLGKSRWQGLRKMQEDGAFCQFESMAYGWRAAFILLTRTYYNNYGADTIGKIISRWAPQIENDTRGYIRLGSPPEHPARWMAVALAMAMFEGGLSDATPILPALFQAWEKNMGKMLESEK